MVWVPVTRVSVGKIVPVPRTPDMLDVQTREAPVSMPSSASVPVPLNVMVSPLL